MHKQEVRLVVFYEPDTELTPSLVDWSEICLGDDGDPMRVELLAFNEPIPANEDERKRWGPIDAHGRSLE